MSNPPKVKDFWTRKKYRYRSKRRTLQIYRSHISVRLRASWRKKLDSKGFRLTTAVYAPRIFKGGLSPTQVPLVARALYLFGLRGIWISHIVGEYTPNSVLIFGDSHSINLVTKLLNHHFLYSKIYSTRHRLAHAWQLSRSLIYIRAYNRWAKRKYWIEQKPIPPEVNDAHRRDHAIYVGLDKEFQILLEKYILANVSYIEKDNRMAGILVKKYVGNKKFPTKSYFKHHAHVGMKNFIVKSR